MKTKDRFKAVDRITEACCCCANSKRRGPGVRVTVPRFKLHYCNECIDKLAKAKQDGVGDHA
jgi:hypothetical protein